jgi:VWFA-related protein
MRRRLQAAAVVLALAHISVVGQTSQDRPTFRSEVRYIEVDVLVTDKDGNAVRGLTKEDFTLLEDGDPQPITNFAFIDLPVETAVPPPATAAAVESDIATNTDQGRTWVMLVNSPDPIAPGLVLMLRRFARQFIDEAFGANDQMAIIHVLDTMNKAQGFTRSRNRLLASVDRIDTSAFTGDSDYLSFQVLEEVSESLGRMTGRRKAVLWFNPPEFFQPDFAPGDPDLRGGPKWFALRDALRAATRNNIAIYPIMPGGLSTSLGMLKEMGAARALAEDTGGDAIVNTNDFSAGFQRFVRDTSTYYLLGYPRGGPSRRQVPPGHRAAEPAGVDGPGSTRILRPRTGRQGEAGPRRGRAALRGHGRGAPHALVGRWPRHRSVRGTFQGHLGQRFRPPRRAAAWR